MKSHTFCIEKDEDGVFVGSIPTMPGCYTQGATLDELMENLQEVVTLCVRNSRPALSEFVDIQKVEVKVK